MELLGPNARHPLLLRAAFAASTNFRGPGYYEDAAVKLNIAFTMASELYDAESIPVARAIYARALLMRDLGDLTEASRLLPQVVTPPNTCLPPPLLPHFSRSFLSPLITTLNLLAHLSLLSPSHIPSHNSTQCFFSLSPHVYRLLSGVENCQGSRWHEKRPVR